MEKKNEELNKTLPPHIMNKLKYWFHRQGRRVRIWGPGRTAQMIAQKIEEAMALKDLRKNQFMARVHADGIVKLDFGAEVPESIKKAALEWAKRKGLKPIEANLSKSDTVSSSVTYKSKGKHGQSDALIAQYVWEVS